MYASFVSISRRAAVEPHDESDVASDDKKTDGIETLDVALALDPKARL